MNRYDGLGVLLMGLRYQAYPIGDRPSPPPVDVYARTYRRVMRKAMREFIHPTEPVGRLTGNVGDGVGRQALVATVYVEVVDA